MRKTMQTGLPRGHFKYKDPHPSIEGRWFLCTNKRGVEIWATLGTFERRKRNDQKRLGARGRAYWDERKKTRKQRDAAYHKEYCKINPRKNGKHNAKRRALLSGAIKDLTQIQIGIIERMYQDCERFNAMFGKRTWHVDHTIPLSMGGKHEPSNLQLVPGSWNLSKHNNHCEKWMVPFG